MNTGWDPYQSLMQCEQNILQCAGAINNGTEVMKDLAYKYNHQQEVIQQLMFNNKKLTGQLNMQSSQITRLLTDIELLKQQLQK